MPNPYTILADDHRRLALAADFLPEVRDEAMALHIRLSAAAAEYDAAKDAIRDFTLTKLSVDKGFGHRSYPDVLINAARSLEVV